MLIWHGQQIGALSGERDDTGTGVEGRARRRTSEETEAGHAGTAGGTVGRDGAWRVQIQGRRAAMM